MCPQMPSIGHCGEIADLVAKPQVSLPWWKLDQLYNIILGRTNLPENYPKMHIKKMHIKHVNPKGPWTEFWEIGDDRMHFLDENALFFSIQGFEKSIYKIEEIRKTHLFSKIAVADSN